VSRKKMDLAPHRFDHGGHRSRGLHADQRSLTPLPLSQRERGARAHPLSVEGGTGARARPLPLGEGRPKAGVRVLWRAVVCHVARESVRRPAGARDGFSRYIAATPRRLRGMW